MNNIWNKQTEFFYSLTPDVIDQSLASVGLRPSGRFFALNSLENRVYDVEVSHLERILEPPFSTESVVVKFYRPGRWSKEALLEEHAFLERLVELEIPVVPPLAFNGETLFTSKNSNLHFAIFPKVRGRLKDELMKDEILQIGRLIGRLHNAGSNMVLSHRATLHPQNFMSAHKAHLEKAEFLPQETVKNYLVLADYLEQLITPTFGALPTQGIHGDLHRGNILWTSQGPYLLDFDDTMTGPREQDLWLLFPGRDEYSISDRENFLEGYHQMSNEAISLPTFTIEALRSLRMVHFNGWIAKRWEDPTFQKSYANFDSQNYWESALLDLKEQLGQLQDAVDAI